MTETASSAASTSTEYGYDGPITTIDGPATTFSATYTTDDAGEIQTIMTTLFQTHTVVVLPSSTTKSESIIETTDVETDVVTETVTAYPSASADCKTGCNSLWNLESIEATSYFNKGLSSPRTTSTKIRGTIEKRGDASSPAPPATTQGPSPKCVVPQEGEHGTVQYVDTCRHVTLKSEGYTPPPIMWTDIAPKQSQLPVAPGESHDQPGGHNGKPEMSHGQPEGHHEPPQDSHGLPAPEASSHHN